MKGYAKFHVDNPNSFDFEFENVDLGNGRQSPIATGAPEGPLWTFKGEGKYYSNDENDTPSVDDGGDQSSDLLDEVDIHEPEPGLPIVLVLRKKY